MSLWTDITPFEVLQTEDFKPAVVSETLQYPNPASNISYVSFKLHQDSNVSLYLYDQQGRKVFTVFENEQKGYGKFIIPIDLDQINLEDGVYYCKLSVNGSFETLRMLVIQK